MFSGSIITFENRATYKAINEVLATEFSDPLHFEHEGQEELEALEGQIYFYHDMLYYVFVTFSSVGYGDIYPSTLECKAIFIIAWIVFIMGLQA